MTKHSSGSRVPVYILAGGRSRRFGSDKARAESGGLTLLQNAANTLAPVASRLTVVARQRGTYADLGFRTIADPVPDRGPMGGLLSALEDASEEWVFVSACDWSGVDTEWARRLIAARADEADVVLFRPQVYEPLFALYHSRLEPEVVRRVAYGPLDLQSFIDHVRTVVVPTPHGWCHARNVNEPLSS